MENLQLKLEIENYQSELQAKDQEMVKLLSEKEDEIQKLELELRDKEGQILSVQTSLDDKKKELEVLIEKVGTLESLQSDMEKQVAVIVERNAETLEDLKSQHQKEIEELSSRLGAEKEETVKAMKEKCKAEVDGLKARFKFMSSIEQKSPVDSIEVISRSRFIMS